MRVNEFKQPIGEALDDFVTPSFPRCTNARGQLWKVNKAKY